MPRVIITEDLYANITEQPKIFKKDMKKFDATKLNKESLYVLESISKKEMDANDIYERFHQQFPKLLDKHAPMKAISKREQKQELKPWITKGMHKSIRVKNELYTNFIKTQDIFYYNRYKIMRDKINHLLRSEKQK